MHEVESDKHGEQEEVRAHEKAERDEALATPVDENFVKPSAASVGCRNALPGYGFVCDYAYRVRGELSALGSTEEERKANWDRGGYRIVLTIDSRLQDAAIANVAAWAPPCLVLEGSEQLAELASLSIKQVEKTRRRLGARLRDQDFKLDSITGPQQVQMLRYMALSRHAARLLILQKTPRVTPFVSTPSS